jgi:hypothetical protein
MLHQHIEHARHGTHAPALTTARGCRRNRPRSLDILLSQKYIADSCIRPQVGRGQNFIGCCQGGPPSLEPNKIALRSRFVVSLNYSPHCSRGHGAAGSGSHLLWKPPGIRVDSHLASPL